MARSYQNARKRKQKNKGQEGGGGGGGRGRTKRRRQDRDRDQAQGQNHAADGEGSSRQQHATYHTEPFTPIEKQNEAFERYYKEQKIIPEGDWDKFMASMRDELPVTFRITGYRCHAQRMLSYLKGHYIGSLVDQTLEGVKMEPPKPMPWYPDELAWQFGATRKDIRKLPEYKKLHDFLVTETESGNISRQEAVSMIPPLLLDVKPHHKVLDMCAAPGSKTAQLIELVHAEQVYGWPEGFVIANDADNKRCYIMVHQAKRLNSPCCMIVNQDATVFPTIKVPSAKTGKPTALKYDRILCDVPCSGDGTLRKNYLIWRKWTTSSGLHLHILQHRILQRGAELLEVGGRMVYSTCSLNPIENEAVIASLLQKCEGTLELIDVSSELPGLQRTQGLKTWKVINDAGQTFASVDDVPQDRKQQYKASIWPPTLEESERLHLDRCIRVFPHLQNTGGFFVAVLRKLAILPWMKQDTSEEPVVEEPSVEPMETDKEPAETPKNTEPADSKGTADGQTSTNNANGSAPQKKKFQGYKEDPFVFFKKDEQIWPQIDEFYGVKEEFPVTQLLTRCHGGKKRNLYLVNNGIKCILEHNEDRLKVINSGVKVWSRSDSKDVPCDFRLAQEGIYSVFPYLATKRKILNITKNDVRTLLTQENPFYFKLDQDAREAVNAVGQGSLIFVYDPKERDPDSTDMSFVVIGWRGKASVRSYISKGERKHILRMCDIDIPMDTATTADVEGDKHDGAQADVAPEADTTAVSPPGVRGGNLEITTADVEGDKHDVTQDDVAPEADSTAVSPPEVRGGDSEITTADVEGDKHDVAPEADTTAVSPPGGEGAD